MARVPRSCSRTVPRGLEEWLVQAFGSMLDGYARSTKQFTMMLGGGCKIRPLMQCPFLRDAVFVRAGLHALLVRSPLLLLVVL